MPSRKSQMSNRLDSFETRAKPDKPGGAAMEIHLPGKAADDAAWEPEVAAVLRKLDAQLGDPDLPEDSMPEHLAGFPKPRLPP